MILYDESIHHEKGKFDLGFTEYLFRQQQARTNSKLKGNYKAIEKKKVKNVPSQSVISIRSMSCFSITLYDKCFEGKYGQ